MIFIGIALVVAVGLALLISTDAGSLVGLTQAQTAQLIPLLVILIVIAGGLFTRRRKASGWWAACCCGSAFSVSRR